MTDIEEDGQFNWLNMETPNDGPDGISRPASTGDAATD